MGPAADWRAEASRLAVYVGAGAIAGGLLGAAGWGAAAGAVAYGARSIYTLNRMQRWLGRRGDEPPEASGQWGAVLDGLYRAQQKDRRERVRLRALISYLRESFMSLPYGAVMIDADGNIEWCNIAAGTLLGLRFPDDTGRHLLNLVRAPEFITYYEAEDYDKPLATVSPHNPDVHLQIHLTFFGRRSRLLFARDVTETHRLEQMRKDFIANVSHELRTPLTVINGYLEAFADGGAGQPDPRWRRALDQMLAQARRMRGLIDDLLLLSRLESVPQARRHTPVSLCALLAMVREEALAAAPDRDITLDCDEGLALLGDYGELHSLVANLVFNAVRYTGAGGRIRLRWGEQEGAASLEVEDNGIGIAAEHIPRLTERFYRVDGSRSMDTGGTGLGLAVVKHVLIRHGGRLDIRSEPGQGSCFRCRFDPQRSVRGGLAAGEPVATGTAVSQLS